MANSVPLSLLQFPGYFTDLDGQPLAFGSLQFFAAGTTDPSTVWADVNGDAALTNPVSLDTYGFAAVFLGPTLYDVLVSDVDGTQLYTREGVGNAGQIFAAGWGNTLATGSSNVSSGYAVLSTDQLVTVSSTGGANPCVIQLPAAATRSVADNGNGLPLTIKNLGTVALAITPAGADTIEGIAGAHSVAASASPLFRTVMLVSDGESAWWILGGIGV